MRQDGYQNDVLPLTKMQHRLSAFQIFETRERYFCGAGKSSPQAAF
jgi:hypothetical protein